MWFPTLKEGRERDGQRWAFMFRWSNGRKRPFDQAYPHRLQMTEAELAQVAERRENPPASTHVMNKRARV